VELSPLAREKLARIGELTDEEKARLKHSEQVTSLLAEYFTNEMSPDDLWKELKKHRDEGREFVVREAQLRILDAMRLSSSDVDINKLNRGLLAAETLKDSGDYAGLEHDLKAIEDLRHQYKDERDKAFNRIKAAVEKQVRLAAQQLAGQSAIKEAEKERIQVFEGVVIRKKKGGSRASFTVRKISYGVSVERIFPLHSPIIEKIEVVQRGRVRRSRIYYLRGLKGKAARIKERKSTTE